MRRGIFCLAGVGLKRICPFCPDTGEVQEYVFIIKIAQPAAVVHRKQRKNPEKSGIPHLLERYSDMQKRYCRFRRLQAAEGMSADGLLGEGVIYQVVKGHPLAMHQFAGLLHHRLQPRQSLLLHDGRGVPGVDLPMAGGDGLQFIQ